MFSYASLNSVTRWLLWSPHLNLDDTRGYIGYLEKQYSKGFYADWGVSLKSGTLIGTVGFADLSEEKNTGEIGYVLNPQYQGKGYMSEAVRAVLSVAFDSLSLSSVCVRIMVGNVNSERLAQRVGFSYICTEEKPIAVKGEEHEIKRYVITRDEYYERRKTVPRT